MATFEDLKQKYFDHLEGIDLAALSMAELATYGGILRNKAIGAGKVAARNIDEMLKPSYTEQMAALMMGCTCKREEVRDDG